MRIALAQITPHDDPARNLPLIEGSVRRAAQEGARAIILPEASLAPFGTDLRRAAREHDAALVALVESLATELDVLIIAGSMESAPDGRVFNSLVARGPGISSRYRKIHLFDAFGTLESETIAPGEELVVLELDGVRIGLATCYDVRFPEQFTALAERGAEVIAVPMAWGDGEGKLEQLRLLLRARALDATVILLAADQSPPEGPAPRHPRGVGHSAVISPLGEVQEELDRAPGLLLADIDPGTVAEARRTLPVLRHRVALDPLT